MEAALQSSGRPLVRIGRPPDIDARSSHIASSGRLSYAEGMLIGYVSDERYVALADVLVHITWAGLDEPLVVRGTPRGALHDQVRRGSISSRLYQTC